MKIAIMSTMPPNTYSGGRYHAWIMGECLAHKENEVYFITNNHPIFYDDFKEYEKHEKIHLCLTDDFEVEIEEETLDYVVLIPNQDKTDYFYLMCRNFALRKKAKLVLVNFESANWFNQYSPVPRDEKMWTFWKNACQDGCLVLSSARESMKYAKEFYTDNPEYTRFDYWYPAINSKVADRINVEKEKRIIAFVRFQDKHKGGGDIFDLLGDYLKGYTLVFVVGNGKIDRIYENKLEFLADKYNFKYEIKLRLSDEEKFREIKKAQIMLFPSYFEGYGYPPIEAQYCNTLCIAYDLPVLRETSGDGLVYCERGNMTAMREALQKAVGQYEERDLKKNILVCGDFEIRAADIQRVLTKYLDDDYRDPRATYLEVVKPENEMPVERSEKRSIASRVKRALIKFRNSVFLRKMEIHLGDRKYDADTGRLYLKGWYLTWRDVSRIEVLNGQEQSLGLAVFGLNRKDIYEKYPRYGTMQLGYRFESNIPFEEMDNTVKIRLVCSDGRIATKELAVYEDGEIAVKNSKVSLLRRIYRTVFLRRMPIHLSLREYDAETGRLHLKGWYLTWRDVVKMEVVNGQGLVLGNARFGQKRRDIYEKYPQYGTVRLGYEFDGIVQKADMDKMLRVRLRCADGTVTWGDFVEKPENEISAGRPEGGTIVSKVKGVIAKFRKAVLSRKIEIHMEDGKYDADMGRLYLKGWYLTWRDVSRIEVLNGQEQSLGFATFRLSTRDIYEKYLRYGIMPPGYRFESNVPFDEMDRTVKIRLVCSDGRTATEELAVYEDGEIVVKNPKVSLLRRIYRTVFLRKMPIHLSLREYDAETGRLHLKGWYLTWRDVDKVEVVNGQGMVLGDADFGLNRSDIYAKHPQYGTVRLGYEFDGIVQKKDMDETLRVRLRCADGTVTWGDFTEEEERA